MKKITAPTPLGVIHTKREKHNALSLKAVPVTAMHPLAPGERIGVAEGKAYRTGGYIVGENVPYHGIVDPFLRYHVKTGDRFWMIRKPN